MNQDMFIQSGELDIILGDKLKVVINYLKSLRVRIVLLIIGFVFLACMLIGVTMLENYEERTVARRTSEIQNQCTILGNQLINSNYLEDTRSDVINAELLQLSNIYNGRVIVVDDEFHIIKDTYNLQEGKTIIAEDVVKCFRGEQTTRYDEENRYIEVGTPIRRGVEEPVLGMMLVSVSTDSIQSEIQLFEKNLEMVISTILIITIIISILISWFIVRPFNRMSQKIKEIADGYGELYIEEEAYTETKTIADAVNRTVERFEILGRSREEFVANVSHELKTPLTALKILSDSLLTQPDVPIELYQEFMQDMSQEIERENKIINDLLELVKLDKTNMNLNIQQYNINQLVEQTLKRLRPLAMNQNVELVFESYRSVLAEVDEAKFTIMIANLVENAIKYNHENGWVRVELNANHRELYLNVSDSGIGIPKESMDHIFERFYRVDKSHSREIGGTGLGLAITRSAVALHKGTISFQSEMGKGTTFFVRIPLTYIK